ncbi:MAG: outer membrane receptor protein involved in Fe transport [Crocinitomicaceae bacterium]|jgi:outer membrane receptor protein involved in Fe transport
MKNLLLLFFIIPFVSLSQINGVIVDETGTGPVYGAKIIASTGEKVLSDVDGKFTLTPVSYPTTLVISAATFVNDTLIVEGPGDLNIEMKLPTSDLKTVVVSVGRRDQEIEDVSISMEIIRPDLVDNKGLSNLEEAVDQAPGVYAMDGQVSIRGGSGFAYGAGSRVLLLWNGIPLLSGDAGDTKWNAVPIECASQIEIMKGASSVLYGSGALNGIISLTEREPTLKGEFRGKVQTGFYDSPKRTSLKWWSKPRLFYQAEAYYGKMYKRFGYTVSTNGYKSDGYKNGETEQRGRISGTIYIRPEKAKNLKAGIGYNMQFQHAGYFIIWESDSLGYTPSGGADTSVAGSTLTYASGLRLSIDPYVKFFDKRNNLHSIKTRLYRINSNNVTNPSQNSNSHVIYGDYQFQHKWNKGTALTSGLTYLRTDVFSNLFGDHYSNNYAAYSQYEQRFDKLDLTAGLRFEYFEQDKRSGDSDFYFGKDSSFTLPVYPVIRLGAHYQVAKYTHLRASFGQGIRYPSVAERYTKTSVGALNVFPNPGLRPEVGWAGEIGIKQAIKIGDKWKGLLDLSGFINQYSNMMEFTFGFYLPDSIAASLDPEAPGYVNDWFGFQAQNAEKARITGLELSFNSQGFIKDVELTSLIGYTYMNPVSLNADSAYISSFSDSGSTVLKYRFNHLFKADIQAQWKGFSIGASARYNSYMTNIDAIFEGEVIPGLSILPGLKEYREQNNNGSLVMDLRFGYEFMEHYRVGFIVNNVLNAEYVTRPGDIQAPRNFIFQLQLKF